MKMRYLGLISLALLLGGCASDFGQTPEPELQTQARAGLKQIIAHAGDREVKPSSWKEAEWENSIQAVKSAINKQPRWIEIDVQLNRHSTAITPATPYGILYVHHDKTCEVINSSGQGTNTKRNIETDPPYLVDQCAERLNNMMNLKWVNGSAITNRWVLEMKSGGNLPGALYKLLKDRGQRTTEIISSLEDANLSAYQTFAVQDGLQKGSLRLMRVHYYGDPVSRGDLDFSKREGFKYVAVNYGNIFTWDVPYAKDIGLQIGGWHWADVSPQAGNTWANNLDFDFMISDAISDLDSKPNWD